MRMGASWGACGLAVTHARSTARHTPSAGCDLSVGVNASVSSLVPGQTAVASRSVDVFPSPLPPFGATRTPTIPCSSGRRCAAVANVLGQRRRVGCSTEGVLPAAPTPTRPLWRRRTSTLMVGGGRPVCLCESYSVLNWWRGGGGFGGAYCDALAWRASAAAGDCDPGGSRCE